MAITEIPALSSLVKRTEVDRRPQVLDYVCGACGQQWEDHLVPFLHADVHVVVKAGVPAELLDPPNTPPPPPMKAGRSSTGDKLLVAGCVAAAVGVHLATLPPAGEGVSVRQQRLALCVGLGVAAGLLLIALRRAFR